MSNITLSANAGGTGIFTISSPSSNTNRTLTLPDVSGTFVTSNAGGNVTISGNLTLADYANIGATGNAAGISLSGGSAANNGGQINLRGGSFGTANAIEFIQGGTERARFDSSGNLLVGTTSQVGFNGGAGANINANGAFRNGVSGSGDSSAWQRSSTGNYLAFFYGALNSNPSNVGSINTNGTNTTYSTSSDYRLKEAVQPMTGALAKVAALKPVTYKWKANGSDGEGFIAHELQAVVPQCVTGEKDAVDAEGKPVYQGIDTSFLVATLTAAIKEQQAIIESLTTRIAALEAA